MASKIPLRPKAEDPNTTTAPPSPATNDEGPDERPIAGTPKQGGPADGRRFIPPPPVQPKGVLICKISDVNQWKDKAGNVARNKKGELSTPSVIFQVIDPKELEKSKKGQPSCYMSEEIQFKMDFSSQWYGRTVKYLADIGCAQSTWPTNPKTADNPAGMPDDDQLCDHIRTTTAGKQFVVDCYIENGKGEYKDTPFVRIKSIKRHVPAAAPRPTAPPKPAAPPPDETDEGAEDDAT